MKEGAKGRDGREGGEKRNGSQEGGRGKGVVREEEGVAKGEGREGIGMKRHGKGVRMQFQGDMSIRGHRKVWQRGKGVSQCMERGKEGRCQREREKNLVTK